MTASPTTSELRDLLPYLTAHERAEMAALLRTSRSPLPHNYQRRGYQLDFWRAFVEERRRRLVWVMHRRGGKDVTAWNGVITLANEWRVGTYWYCFPKLDQARRTIWRGITNEGRRFLDYIPRDRIATRDGRPAVNSTELSVEFANGSILQLLGSDNYNNVVGANPVCIVFSEWALCDPAALDYFRPMVAANDGILVFLYTPRGHNHGKDTLDTYRRLAEREPARHFCQVLTVDATRAIPPERIEQDRAEGMGDDLVQQEYYCSFEAALSGAYYGQQLRQAREQGRIGRVPWVPTLPVHTSWDLGIDDATAIWFWQLVGAERHAIDYLEASGEGLPFYAKLLQSRPYVYGQHYGPHDIAVRELGTGKSRLETAAALGVRFTVVPQHAVEDRIEAVRGDLPRWWFDEEHCAAGIRALERYTKDWDEQRQVFRSFPRHDQYSHGADGFGTGVMGHGTGVVQELPQATVTLRPWQRAGRR